MPVQSADEESTRCHLALSTLFAAKSRPGGQACSDVVSAAARPVTRSGLFLVSLVCALVARRGGGIFPRRVVEPRAAGGVCRVPAAGPSGLYLPSPPDCLEVIYVGVLLSRHPSPCCYSSPESSNVQRTRADATETK
jgi:hypothetical protein